VVKGRSSPRPRVASWSKNEGESGRTGSRVPKKRAVLANTKTSATTTTTTTTTTKRMRMRKESDTVNERTEITASRSLQGDEL
jgi:hypothetical protein